MSGIARQRLSDQVAQHLRELIIEGEIPAGRPLSTERQLATQFGVSSVVIREALKNLSTNGFVEIRHGVGSFVTTPDHWRVAEPIATLIRSRHADLLHVVETRAILEIEISALAAERSTTSTLAALDTALARMETTLDEPVANATADMEFHRILATCAANPVLTLVLQPLLAPIHTSMLRGTRQPEATRKALLEHSYIRDAIATQQPDVARAAMRIHMDTAREEVKAQLHNITANKAEQIVQ